MKKTYLLLMLSAVMAVSCDMDKEPYDSVPDTEALNSPTSFQSARTGLYSALKSSIAGTFYNAPEIQCDGFDAVTGFSNTLGEMYRWTFTTQTTTFDGVYGNYQAMIARANFIIDTYNKTDFSNKGVFPDEATQTNPGMPAVRAAKGDAFFIRAYSIFMLSQFFCPDYEASNEDTPNLGVSYSLSYNPSKDQTTYPGRYTLKETFDQIYDDLDSAAIYVSRDAQYPIYYINPDAIRALRARAALARGDYETAADNAERVIVSGNYDLAQSATEIEDMWQNDNAQSDVELILQLPTTSQSDLPLATGTLYQPQNTGAVPDYIPTQTLLNLYSANDYRRTAYFNTCNITTNNGAIGTVYAFNKYPLYGYLYQGLGGYSYALGCSQPKVFRLAEMYLIAAEAFANIDGELYLAADYLNELKAARIQGYRYQNFTNKEEFMAELMDERQRELVGEGTRLFDIKRWHIDLRRGTPQNESLCLLPGPNTTEMSVAADSPRLTWPIPKHEMDVNRAIVQNPGY